MQGTTVVVASPVCPRCRGVLPLLLSAFSSSPFSRRPSQHPGLFPVWVKRPELLSHTATHMKVFFFSPSPPQKLARGQLHKPTVQTAAAAHTHTRVFQSLNYKSDLFRELCTLVNPNAFSRMRHNTNKELKRHTLSLTQAESSRRQTTWA